MFMDVVPTHRESAELSASLAFSYSHCFFLSQPYPVLETMIGKDPIAFTIVACKVGAPLPKVHFQKNQIMQCRKSWRNED